MRKDVDQWFKNDKLFKSELEAGHRWQFLPAMRLMKEGFAVQVPSLSMRKDIKDRNKYENEVDIWVGNWKTRVKLSCKSRRLKFSSASDYPYRTAFVDTKQGWDVLDPKPVAVLIISRETKDILVVPGSTQSKWDVENKFDRIRKIEETSYAAPRSCLKTFDDLIERLHQKFD